MEFMLFGKNLSNRRSGYVDREFLVDITDEQEAVRYVEANTIMNDPGDVIGLFACERRTTVRAICGWKKSESGDRKKLPAKYIEGMFDVTSDTFDFCRPGSGDLKHLRRT